MQCHHDFHKFGSREAADGERPLRKSLLRKKPDGTPEEFLDCCDSVWCPHCGLVREAWYSGSITQFHLKFE